MRGGGGRTAFRSVWVNCYFSSPTPVSSPRQNRGPRPLPGPGQKSFTSYSSSFGRLDLSPNGAAVGFAKAFLGVPEGRSERRARACARPRGVLFPLSSSMPGDRVGAQTTAL